MVQVGCGVAVGGILAVLPIHCGSAKRTKANTMRIRVTREEATTVATVFMVPAWW